MRHHRLVPVMLKASLGVFFPVTLEEHLVVNVRQQAALQASSLQVLPVHGNPPWPRLAPLIVDYKRHVKPGGVTG